MPVHNDSPQLENCSIAVVAADNKSGRKYDKRSYCHFCGLSQSKLARHLRLKHRYEEEVDDFLHETSKQKRNTMLLTLRNLGNHAHNMSVLKEKSDDIIAVHRPTDHADYRRYIPCRYCYGYLSKDSIWKHSCLLAPKTKHGTTKPRVRKGGKELLQETAGQTAGFNELLSGMRQDADGILASKDALILQYGKSLCTKFGGDHEQFIYIRSNVRQAAKLLGCLCRISSQTSWTVSNFIRPTQFKLVVQLLSAR